MIGVDRVLQTTCTQLAGDGTKYGTIRLSGKVPWCQTPGMAASRRSGRNRRRPFPCARSNGYAPWVTRSADLAGLRLAGRFQDRAVGPEQHIAVVAAADAMLLDDAELQLEALRCAHSRCSSPSAPDRSRNSTRSSPMRRSFSGNSPTIEVSAIGIQNRRRYSSPRGVSGPMRVISSSGARPGQAALRG